MSASCGVYLGGAIEAQVRTHRKYRSGIFVIAGVYQRAAAAASAQPLAIVSLANRHFHAVRRPGRVAATRRPCVALHANRKGQTMNMRSPLPLEQMPRTLEGKVSLITGSTSGIGLGIGRALAAAGSAVVLNGFGKPEDIAEAQARVISEFGVEVRYSPADMSKSSAIADLIAITLSNFGRLDILVNNAGIQHVAPLEQFPVETWDAILAINLSSAFHTTRAALPSMRKNNFGRIINIASAHGLVASPFKSAYVAAKHGIIGLTKVTALETAEANITCNAICPGYVYTPLVAAQIDDQATAHNIPREQVIRDVLLAQQPNKRFATVEELGALSVFLASDAASSITGIALPVDGGWTAH
jgi:3-hydroxybutyrate dehydrogenase